MMMKHAGALLAVAVIFSTHQVEAAKRCKNGKKCPNYEADGMPLSSWVPDGPEAVFKEELCKKCYNEKKAKSAAKSTAKPASPAAGSSTGSTESKAKVSRGLPPLNGTAGALASSQNRGAARGTHKVLESKAEAARNRPRSGSVPDLSMRARQSKRAGRTRRRSHGPSMSTFTGRARSMNRPRKPTVSSHPTTTQSRSVNVQNALGAATAARTGPAATRPRSSKGASAASPVAATNVNARSAPGAGASPAPRNSRQVLICNIPEQVPNSKLNGQTGIVTKFDDHAWGRVFWIKSEAIKQICKFTGTLSHLYDDNFGILVNQRYVRQGTVVN